MFFLAFILFTAASSLNKILKPGKSISFIEELTENDYQLAFSLSNLSKDQLLYMNINFTSFEKINVKKKNVNEYSSELDSLYNGESGSNADSSTMISQFVDKTTNYFIDKKFTKPGRYEFILKNRGSNIIEIQISLIVQKKIIEKDKNMVEIKNLLNNLQTAMEKFGNENYYLNNLQIKSIKDADSISKLMNWLIIFPLFTLLVGYIKYVMSVQLIKPKRERFKGLF